MSGTFKITIAGKEYTLSGENEESVRHAAELVDKKIRELRKTYVNEPVSTITVLAALNIAEQNVHKTNTVDKDRLYLVNELTKMADFLKLNI